MPQRSEGQVNRALWNTHMRSMGLAQLLKKKLKSRSSLALQREEILKFRRNVLDCLLQVFIVHPPSSKSTSGTQESWLCPHSWHQRQLLALQFSVCLSLCSSSGWQRLWRGAVLNWFVPFCVIGDLGQVKNFQVSFPKAKKYWTFV